MTAVDFYFDCSCPWSYLASVRLQETAVRTGSTIVWKPVVVDRVRGLVDSNNASSRLDPLAARERYREKDRRDWADYCGISMTIPSGWPADATKVMTACIIADEQGRARSYVRSVFQAYFDEGQDISDEYTLIRIAESVDIDGAVFSAALRDSAALARLHANCDELIRRGGFGTPTLFVADSMYFGNDRMPLVEFAIGQASERTFVMPGQHGP